MPADSAEVNYIKEVLKTVLIEVKNQLQAQGITLDLQAIKQAVANA